MCPVSDEATKRYNFYSSKPKPSALTVYLYTVIFWTMGESNQLCQTCYNFQLSIKQEATTVSFDEDLELKLQKLRLSVESFCKSQHNNVDFYLTWATEATCIFFAETPIANRALLLPDIVRYLTVVLCSKSKLQSAAHLYRQIAIHQQASG